jgi:hypothetical protein
LGKAANVQKVLQQLDEVSEQLHTIRESIKLPPMPRVVGQRWFRKVVEGVLMRSVQASSEFDAALAQRYVRPMARKLADVLYTKNGYTYHERECRCVKCVKMMRRNAWELAQQLLL